MCALYTQHPWSRKPSTQVLLGPSELARALRLRSPSVVTNWRARSPEFPDDRIGGSQPRFDLVEVVEWMLDHGPRSATTHMVTAIDWWGYLCEAFTLSRPTETPRHTVAALLAVREVSLVRRLLGEEGVDRWSALEEPTASDLAALARWAERELPDLRGLLVPWFVDLDERAVAGVRDMVDVLGRLVDVPGVELLDAALDAGRDQRPRQQRVTAPHLARLMVALGGITDHDVVIDPAAGEGEVVLAAHRAAPGARVIGSDVDEESLGLARLRNLVEGGGVELHPPGDAFRAPWLQKMRADLVVIDPPIDGTPPIDRWLALGLEHLDRNGRVVMTLPLHLLVPVRAVRRKPDPRVSAMVDDLAERGALRAVVVMNPRVRNDVVGPIAICVVQPDASATSRIEVVVVGDDATNLDVLDLAEQVGERGDASGIEDSEVVHRRQLLRRGFLDELVSVQFWLRLRRVREEMTAPPSARVRRVALSEHPRSVVLDAEVRIEESILRPPTSAAYRDLAIAAIQELMARDVETARELLLKLEELDRISG